MQSGWAALRFPQYQTELCSVCRTPTEVTGLALLAEFFCKLPTRDPVPQGWDSVKGSASAP